MKNYEDYEWWTSGELWIHKEQGSLTDKQVEALLETICERKLNVSGYRVVKSEPGEKLLIIKEV